jgi:hypothetical protein
MHLISIVTTDSQYKLFGFSVGDDFGKADLAFAENRYEQIIHDGILEFQAGKITIRLDTVHNMIPRMRIGVEVTNNLGVVF